MQATINFSSTHSHVDTNAILKGNLQLFGPATSSLELTNHALKYVSEAFPNGWQLQKGSDAELAQFIAKAQIAKSSFTNCETTKRILEKLIRVRYENIQAMDIFYDVPRLRIIPNSSLLNSGISYNYRPHRDTWYGGGQEQINHWISVNNVTEDSTFYISPSYFSTKIANNSEKFDLDVWDSTHRKDATNSVRAENDLTPFH